ncbi:4-oxalomesaconate tautomerase [Ensifer sp. 4252]|uniref:4-oxalomesaconate tautomerase n=1 Tax=Ensifer sp. 4252 TaxID=3373915 RepID=UPI003D1BE8F2
MSDGLPCMWMRGGTSKGAFFLAKDLPPDPQARDALLLHVMGSPDARQIDGIGGANPLTSKVAVVRKSIREDVDIDYLFLQVFVEQAVVTDAQPCGNILAAVAPFAIERGLVAATGTETQVTILMENTGEVATATVLTQGGKPIYVGNAAISGVPGTAAPIPLVFRDIAGSSCGALLPTGNAVDTIDGIEVTLIDNGMPVVVLAAADMGISGEETPAELDTNETLKVRLEKIRLKAGPLMNLGDVALKSVPKMTLVAHSQAGYALTTRTFIPHRCHAAIGVFGAVSVASAALLPGSPANRVAVIPDGVMKTIAVGHPEGETSVILEIDAGTVRSAAILRTARKLFDGRVY